MLLTPITGFIQMDGGLLVVWTQLGQFFHVEMLLSVEKYCFTCRPKMDNGCCGTLKLPAFITFCLLATAMSGLTPTLIMGTIDLSI
jgi:hypothetical protein